MTSVTSLIGGLGGLPTVFGGIGNDTIAIGGGLTNPLSLATVLGGIGASILGSQTLIGGAGSVLNGALMGSTTFVGTTAGSDTMNGGLMGNNLYDILQKGGTHTINWALGNNQLYVENLSWQQLQPDISYSGANTVITLDGGATKITVVGHHLTSGDIKP